jgi:glucose/arabinose dehydrogenase
MPMATRVRCVNNCKRRLSGVLFACAMLMSACRGIPAAPPTAARTADVVEAIPTTAVASTPTRPASSPTPTQAPAAAATATPRPEASATAEVAPSPTPAPAPTAAAGKPTLSMLVEGLEKPTYLTHAGDGSGLIYVLEQPGRIRVIRDGALIETPFLDIEERVGSGGNEQGLLGLAFAPDYKTSKRFFVNYTDKDGDTVVAGFIAADGFLADADSEWQVIKIDQPYGNHNGGDIKFGPDGMLYIGMGDGGSAGDPQNYAQNPKSLLGKMLRIDVSESAQDAPYRVPDGNPKFGAESLPELWSIGLRNPWRFSFDRGTGAMFIADVGQNKIEEVNYQPPGRAGDNYGWKLREGTAEYSGKATDYLIEPVAEYEHGEDGCSITGGYVYRGPTLTALQGAYIYADFCSGRVWRLRQDGDRWSNTRLFDTDYSVSSFGEDESGELYLLVRSGEVYRFEAE